MKGLIWVLQQVIPTEAGQGTLQEGNPNDTISDQSGMSIKPNVNERGGPKSFSRPACFGPTNIVSLGIMCVLGLGQAVQTLSYSIHIT